jgi:hypothetical protein
MGGSNRMARLIHSLASASGVQLPLRLVAQPILKLLLIREDSCAKRPARRGARGTTAR